MGGDVSETRKEAVLRAIVESYVATHEPVASKALAQYAALGVSPATIRNDMAALEDEGLIAQPHTSAGRVPTDKGYRYFVDMLASAALQESHQRAISTFLADAVELNDVVERSVRLLSHLTRQVAVVQYPSLRESAVRRVELVRMGPDRALAVVVSADARVEQAPVHVPTDLSDEDFDKLARELNEAATGLTPAPLERALESWAARHLELPWLRELAAAVAAAAKGGTVERVVFAGTGNLTRSGGDLASDEVAAILDALEEQVVLLRLLHEMSADGPLAVRIGSETGHDALAGTSIVAAGYGTESAPSLLGALGPTRMDYPATMAAVRAVARYLSKAVSQ